MWIPIPPFSEALKAALKLTSEGAGKPRPGWILRETMGKHFQPPKRIRFKKKTDGFLGKNIGGFDHIFKAFRIGVARPLPGSFEKEKDLVGPSCCNKSHACCLRFMNLLLQSGWAQKFGSLNHSKTKSALLKANNWNMHVPNFFVKEKCFLL